MIINNYNTYMVGKVDPCNTAAKTAIQIMIFSLMLAYLKSLKKETFLTISSFTLLEMFFSFFLNIFLKFIF